MGGGLLITMLADVAVASDRAVFGAPELLRGVADAYHAAILPEHVGIAIARDMLFTGRRLDANEAERHGLVARVVPHDELEPATERIVAEVLHSAPTARTAMKRLLNARYGMVDKITFDESVHGDEVVEGFRSFMDKRPPGWVPDALPGD
jgi:enoyl-CoA hydratase/carnithine racemase